MRQPTRRIDNSESIYPYNCMGIMTAALAGIL
ncbi:hypothetical protein N825_01410 [Skermanella stibiiresistens SB22]|uniref:Uncharacterized protein n=1 Tax=Skermanella stibiiresistens SB22 TaxID=1385369 RepID=W9HDP3_9PROT|nr:hypothetical protein N825_01410 [Skermanella stibiiresistens SB22]